LSLSQPAHRCRRIDRLTSLEALRITEGCIDDQALREISALQNLRQLSLNGLSESADLSFLPGLPKLSAVDFYHCSLNSAALRNIGQCSGLKVVSLYMADVDGRAVRHLANLANLEDLDLSYSDVTSNDVAPLAALKRLRNLDLTRTQVGGDLHFAAALENLETLSLYDTNVTGKDLEPLTALKRLHSLDLGYTEVAPEGVAYLRQMKQLRWLRLSGVDEDEKKQLQAELPVCEIVLH
jgi:Leucine-rich repeat (LRR) protein